MDKFYWVRFKVIKLEWGKDGRFIDKNEIDAQELTSTHPIELLIARQKEYGEEFEIRTPPGHKSREDYTLINWKEVSKEIYEKFKGHL